MTSSPPSPPAIKERVTGPAFTALGFKTWMIVCHDDAIVFVRAPWFLGLPIVLLLGGLACFPLAWLQVTIRGTNHSPVSSAVMAVGAILAIVLLVRFWIRFAKAWQSRVASSSIAELTRGTESVTFDLATVRSMRFARPNELWITTMTEERMFGVYGQKPIAVIRAAYPTLWNR